MTNIMLRVSTAMTRYAIILCTIILLVSTFFAVDAMAQSKRKIPYWASIDKNEARMRTGPSTEYPVKWIYKRKNLPVKVLDIHQNWRKVQDPDGDQGWMHVKLLSPTRTAMVTSTSNAELLREPSAGSKIAWRAEPGVVGRIDDCANGYCRMDIAGQTGYIGVNDIMGEEDP